jgi:hypothetical protein
VLIRGEFRPRLPRSAIRSDGLPQGLWIVGALVQDVENARPQICALPNRWYTSASPAGRTPDQEKAAGPVSLVGRGPGTLPGVPLAGLGCDRLPVIGALAALFGGSLTPHVLVVGVA